MPPENFAETAGLCFAFRQRDLLLNADGTLPFGQPAQLFGSNYRSLQYLGDHAGQPCFGIALADDAVAPIGTHFSHLKKQLEQLPETLGHLAGRALEIIEWETTHRFCGACGAPTAQKGTAIVRICCNADCRREHYPRVSPVVIVAVECGEAILLGRSPHFPPGMYSTLAGFVDAGETVEAAVHREIFEESGLTVGNLRYFTSQPWPFPHSLMLGFQADYVSGELCVGTDELEDAAFFPVDRLPAFLPGPSTIAHWLIRDFCRRHGRHWPAS